MPNKAKYYKQWRKEHPDYSKNYLKKYLQTEKGKITNRKWRKEHPEHIKNYLLKYRQTGNGKTAHNKSQAKRKRNLDWIPLFENPFIDSELIDWHHIDNTYVVAIPRDLHQMYRGEFHREQVRCIVEQIYSW